MNILYEDNHLLVVIKEPGILSQEDKTGDTDMLSLIKAYLKDKYHKPGNVFLGLIHRLDRMVGGVMVFAKTSKSASRLSKQVREHKIGKKYLAIVHGITEEKATLINYLYKDNKNNIVYVKDKDCKVAQKAELSFQRLNIKTCYSLLEINLKTGRPHQIRVQLAHINRPLLGDKKYGINDKFSTIALYAHQLSFYHPITKEQLTFTSQPLGYPFDIFYY